MFDHTFVEPLRPLRVPVDRFEPTLLRSLTCSFGPGGACRSPRPKLGSGSSNLSTAVESPKRSRISFRRATAVSLQATATARCHLGQLRGGRKRTCTAGHRRRGTSTASISTTQRRSSTGVSYFHVNGPYSLSILGPLLQKALTLDYLLVVVHMTTDFQPQLLYHPASHLLGCLQHERRVGLSWPWSSSS